MRPLESAARAMPRGDDSPAFGRIVCEVPETHGSPAVEQSIALADPGGALTFVCVHRDESPELATKALGSAVQAAAAAGIEADGRIRHAANPSEVLLEEAADADLLTVASPGGAALGTTASAAVHDCTVPVLVARQPPAGAAFPGRILLATDGSPDAQHAAELAGRIARRAHSQVDVLSVDPEPHGDASQIAVDIVSLTTALGFEPTVLREAGRAHERILAIAERERISLLVLGSRGLGGLRALGSVSERVAHRAPSSVLVARR